MGITEAIQAVIFDLDGVLIHSVPIHLRAFQHVLAEYAISDFDYAPYSGWRTTEVITDVFSRRGIAVCPETISDIAAAKSRLALSMLDAQPPLVSGCGRLLAKLATVYPLALASSGRRASVESFLRSSGSATLFRSVLSSEDVTHAKPSPDIYRLSAERLGVKPAQCLVIEDAVAGVQAAVACGAPVWGIAGTCPESALREAGASHVIAGLEELEELLSAAEGSGAVKRSDWTAVIPAAGRGSRLGFHLPKILYPVAGRMILDWLLDLLEPNCSRLVFVLAPTGVEEVRAELDRCIPGRYEIAIQHDPSGMGDAVALALPLVQTKRTAVIWGDQACLQRASVDLCLRLHQGPLHPDATVPTLYRETPYIHFERGPGGGMTAVKQAREGDVLPEFGESDAGFFCFQTDRLRRSLAELKASGLGWGRQTREFNLLPVLPRLAQQGTILTPRVVSLEETIGINNRHDAAIVEAYLRRPGDAVS